MFVVLVLRGKKSPSTVDRLEIWSGEVVNVGQNDLVLVALILVLPPILTYATGDSTVPGFYASQFCVVVVKGGTNIDSAWTQPCRSPDSSKECAN